MKIRLIVIFFAGFLSAQGLSDYGFLDIEINEDMIVVGSKGGVNWKTKDDNAWKSIKCLPFGANVNANLDNIVLNGNDFAVKLELENKNEVPILYTVSGKDKFVKHKIPDAKPERLFGCDGFFGVYDEHDNYFFALGDAGVALLNPTVDSTSIISSDFYVNSIIGYGGDFIALSSDGEIMLRNSDAWTKIDSLILQSKEPKEYAIKFIKGTNDFPIFILTTDDYTEKLYRWNVGNKNLIHSGGISKVAISPDNFIYILDNDGRLDVCEIDGKKTQDSEKRREVLLRRIAKTNIPLDYKLTDISIYGRIDTPTTEASVYKEGSFFIGFASNKGVLYSKNGLSGITDKDETPFEYFSKEVPIKKGLKEIYAEPGIINHWDNSCTFEYSLSQDDKVTIDILNYNLDFVCRIVTNVPRNAAVGSEHSTLRSQDYWDGTVNNNGGKSVPPGVYYFKITTQKGDRAVGKVVVAR
ncbi:MAG: hypothetical protein LBH98_08745 [Chitinispirillales bacterium]|jgi:hypothetical protein|nr:hypothetical protein [Chitinispirillales bacterium]